MSDWWTVIAVVALAAVGIQYVRSRRSGNGRSGADRGSDAGAPSDYRQDREDARRANMSETDRAWEAASLQRNQEAQERDDNVSERRA